MKRIAALSALLLVCLASHSQVASDCIKLGQDADSRTLTNTCSKPVVVAWCHQGSDAKGTLSSLCNGGDNKRLFRMSKTLDAGKTSRNRYSLPLGSGISYGACFGSFADFQRVGSTGHYVCRLSRNPDETVVMRSTAAAPTAEQACDQARSVAGSAQPCDCENRTETLVACSVTTSQPRPDANFRTQAKAMLRKLLDCEPGDGKACDIPSTHRAAIASRG